MQKNSAYFYVLSLIISENVNHKNQAVGKKYGNFSPRQTDEQYDFFPEKNLLSHI